MNDLLNLVARERADELRLEPGKPPIMILHGEARVLDDYPLTSDNVGELFASIATEDQRRELGQCGDIRFHFTGQHSSSFVATALWKGKALQLTITNVGR